MLHDEKLYHLILQRFNGRMSSSLYGYLHEYSKMYLAHGGWSLEGTKQWTDALEALQKAEHAHARSLLLRQDRRTMEIGSAVLFLRGFERLLKLVGLPQKKEEPQGGIEEGRALECGRWEQTHSGEIIESWRLSWADYCLSTMEYDGYLHVLVFYGKGTRQEVVKAWVTQRGTYPEMCHFFDGIRLWLRGRVDPNRIIAPHPKYERGG